MCVPADLWWTTHSVFRVAKCNTELGAGWADGCWSETVVWLNQFRRLRVRCEKRADTDEAFLGIGVRCHLWEGFPKETMATRLGETKCIAIWRIGTWPESVHTWTDA